uniref:Uncharacterized protein n=1 Tax=Lepeophtheirus salmonis TaxID=72036 RepID=A0A0K2V9D6_LEPSM
MFKVRGEWLERIILKYYHGFIYYSLFSSIQARSEENKKTVGLKNRLIGSKDR